MSVGVREGAAGGLAVEAKEAADVGKEFGGETGDGAVGLGELRCVDLGLSTWPATEAGGDAGG